jgi:predicted dehydrogenase
MSHPLRVGVIGCGGIAQMMHLPFLAERRDLFSLDAICDLNPAALDAVGARFGVKARFHDAAALLALPLDAVLILSADPHAPAVLDAAGAGKHIFVEKPLAFTLEEIDAVEAAVAAAQVKLMVGYMKRYDPAFIVAADLLAPRTDLRHLQISVWHPDDAAYRMHYHLTPPPELYNPATMLDELGATEPATRGPLAPLIDTALGPGASLDQRRAYLVIAQSIVHQLNVMCGLLGAPEAVVSTHIWHDARGIQSTFRFSSQLYATLTWLFVPGVRHYQEIYRFLAPEFRLELEYASPYLKHVGAALRVEGMADGAAWRKEITPSYQEAFHAELLHFHHCIVAGETPRTGIADARRDTALAIAMIEACR